MDAGDWVEAPPWKGGRELKPQKGLVISTHWHGPESEYAIVWFPRMGEPAIGHTVMPILRIKISPSQL
jgi:Family of unknown function (DUF6409)